MKLKRKLRIFISSTVFPAKLPSEGQEGSIASWELRVEGRLLEDVKSDTNKVRPFILSSRYLDRRLIFGCSGET